MPFHVRTQGVDSLSFEQATSADFLRHTITNAVGIPNESCLSGSRTDVWIIGTRGLTLWPIYIVAVFDIITQVSNGTLARANVTRETVGFTMGHECWHGKTSTVVLVYYEVRSIWGRIQTPKTPKFNLPREIVCERESSKSALWEGYLSLPKSIPHGGGAYDLTELDNHAISDEDNCTQKVD